MEMRNTIHATFKKQKKVVSPKRDAFFFLGILIFYFYFLIFIFHFFPFFLFGFVVSVAYFSFLLMELVFVSLWKKNLEFASQHQENQEISDKPRLVAGKIKQLIFFLWPGRKKVFFTERNIFFKLPLKKLFCVLVQV